MRLHNVLYARTHDLWALLAAVVGNPLALNKLMKRLSRDGIDQARTVMPPGDIGDCIEAIAAFDPWLLVPLSKTWRRLDDIASSKELHYNYWYETWRTSLRHLRKSAAIQREDVHASALSRYIARLWSPPCQTVIAWYELNDAYLALPYPNDSYIADRASCPLRETHLSRSDLQAVDPGLLRMLRHRTYLLSGDAKAYILDATQQALSTYEMWCESPTLVCLELALEIAPDIRSSFEDHVMRMITTMPHRVDPRNILPLVSVLLTNWRVP